MEKRKLSGKTILKLAGALLALSYLGFYFYVGITGKLPCMHETLWTRLWLIEENEDNVVAVVFDLETFSMESYTKVK